MNQHDENNFLNRQSMLIIFVNISLFDIFWHSAVNLGGGTKVEGFLEEISGHQTHNQKYFIHFLYFIRLIHLLKKFTVNIL